MKNNLFRHIGAFLLSVFLAVALLLAGACLPQGPIDRNVRISAEGMIEEGGYPTMADHAFASILDYVTDALILEESKATTITRWDTVFTNPLYEYGGDAVENLYQYTHDPDPQPTGYYVQYWMGFRPVIRLLLCFLDYYQILRYTALAFFVLLASVICDVAKRAGSRTAFLFALSIIFVRPHVVAVSLQFTCCFFIAFLAMLAVPWIRDNRRWESLFFLELGIATMYFDFYTTPILTFCLPMTYLYVLRSRNSQATSAKSLIRNAAVWIAGYVGMWLAKLSLTSLLTDTDGLGTGFSSFAGRVGIEKEATLESYYNPIMALRTVAISLYSDHTGKWIFLLACGMFCLLVLICFLRKKPSIPELANHWLLLLLAFLPILWFMGAAQPTANHHWFQYRGIAATFWAGLVYLQYTLSKETT